MSCNKSTIWQYVQMQPKSRPERINLLPVTLIGLVAILLAISGPSWIASEAPEQSEHEAELTSSSSTISQGAPGRVFGTILPEGERYMNTAYGFSLTPGRCGIVNNFPGLPVEETSSLHIDCGPKGIDLVVRDPHIWRKWKPHVADLFQMSVYDQALHLWSRNKSNSEDIDGNETLQRNLRSPVFTSSLEQAELAGVSGYTFSIGGVARDDFSSFSILSGPRQYYILDAGGTVFYVRVSIDEQDLHTVLESLSFNTASNQEGD